MITRPDTWDNVVVREVLKYEKHVPILPTDRWLDIGAHIGAFSALVLNRGAQVVAFEPDAANYELLRQNAPAALPRFMAVLAEGGVNIPLYLNGGGNLASHTTLYTRGRKVIKIPAVGINDAIRLHQPNKIKLDCEGAEYKIIKALDFQAAKLDGIVVEFHVSKLHDRNHTKFMEIVSIISENFLQCEYNHNLGKSWTTMIYGKNSC